MREFTEHDKENKKKPGKIKEKIEKNEHMKHILSMPEKDIKEHIKELKKEIFKDKIGTIS